MMTTRLFGTSPLAAVCRAAGVLALVIGTAVTPARAQSAPPAEETATAAAEQPPPPRGLFGNIGRWVDDSLAGVTSRLKGANEQLGAVGGQAAGAALDAAATVARLPATGVVNGRERCETAANGAPDCLAATAALCKAKGFAAGRSLDVETSRKCPTQAWLSGRAPKLSDCTTEYAVTRAICQ